MKRPGKMLGECVDHLCKKPATISYPAEKVVMPANFRGQMIFDPAKCVGCRMCVKDCPAFAIDIVKVGEKKFEAVFDLDKCLYCAQCVDSCFKKAISISANYELAQVDKSKFKVVFHNAESEKSEEQKTDSDKAETSKTP
jgi:formate hydrogenlyase subunit 6/NADH:ubiquinone oxidoreductase subunit I